MGPAPGRRDHRFRADDLTKGTRALWSRFIEVILSIFLARILGHGRAVESYLVLFAGSYGIALLFVPEAAFSSQATRDLAWMGYGPWVAIPFLLKSIVSGYGVLANIYAWRRSREFRIIGALIGMWIWSTMVYKFILVGSPYTIGSFAAGWAFFFSIRIVALAIANRPLPGSAGVM